MTTANTLPNTLQSPTMTTGFLPQLKTDTPERRQLLSLIQQLSIQHGDFTLASGKKSTYYIDCRLTTLSAEGAYLIGKLLYQAIEPLNVDSVGGVVMGSAPIVTGISTYSASTGQQTIPGFLIRKATKGHGTQKMVEGHIKPWMRVVLVEDVVTTAGSILKGIDALRAEYPTVDILGVVSLVDRNAGGREAFEKAAIPYQSLYNVDECLQG